MADVLFAEDAGRPSAGTLEQTQPWARPPTPGGQNLWPEWLTETFLRDPQGGNFCRVEAARAALLADLLTVQIKPSHCYC
jgi:hypothetical protein